MRGKVERRAAQVLRGWKDVPENFTEADDFHEESVSGREGFEQVIVPHLRCSDSILQSTHTSGFAYARLQCGLTCGRASGARIGRGNCSVVICIG
jgi:hypothetical protein